MTKTGKLIYDVIAIAGAIAGSSLIASNIGMNRYGYIAFLASSIATWFLLVDCKASMSLKGITLFYILINLVGFIRYF